MTLCVESEIDRETAPGVLSGLQFFVAQRVPSRSHLIDLIYNNGGIVTKLETRADYKIADHVRKDCPPESVSYTFIETAIKTAALPDPENHACVAGSGSARPTSSAMANRKTTRTNFTSEDDRLLLAYLKQVAARGERINGNVPYHIFVQQHPHHPWQSWRHRWVTILSKEYSMAQLLELDDDGRRPKQAADTPAGLEHDSDSNEHSDHSDESSETPFVLTSRHHKLISALEARKPADSNGLQFTTEEITHLVGGLADIPSINAGDWTDAWADFAAAAGQTHSPNDWQRFYASHVRVVLDNLNWSHSMQERTPRKSILSHIDERTASMPTPSPSEPASAASEYYTPSKQKSPSQSQPRSSHKRKAASPKVLTPHKTRKLSATSASRASTSGSARHSPPVIAGARPESVHSASAFTAPMEQTPKEPTPSYTHQQEKVQWMFEHAQKRKEVQSTTSHSRASVELPAQHRLTAENLATQSQLQALTHELHGDATIELAQDTAETAAAQPSGELMSSLAADRPVLSYTAGTPADDPGLSFDSALLATGPRPVHAQTGEVVDAERDTHNSEEDYELDLTVPSPCKPATAASQSQAYETARDGRSQYIQPQQDQISKSYRMDTQAILNAETQWPDLSMPLPFEASDESQEDVGSAQSQAHNSRFQGKKDSRSRPAAISSPNGLAARIEIDEDAIEAFYSKFHEQGHSEDDITEALHMTSARPDLAEYVLVLQKQGRSLPPDIRGIWTAVEDADAQGGDSRKLRDLETKHGWNEVCARIQFLSDLANDSQ